MAKRFTIKQCIKDCLRDPNLTTSAIAKRCGCTEPWVRRVRAELELTYGSIERIRKNLGEDIINNPLLAGKTKREIIMALKAAHPEWTLAKIALAARTAKAYVREVLTTMPDRTPQTERDIAELRQYFRDMMVTVSGIKDLIPRLEHLAERLEKRLDGTPVARKPKKRRKRRRARRAVPHNTPAVPEPDGAIPEVEVIPDAEPED